MTLPMVFFCEMELELELKNENNTKRNEGLGLRNELVEGNVELWTTRRRRRRMEIGARMKGKSRGSEKRTESRL